MRGVGGGDCLSRTNGLCSRAGEACRENPVAGHRGVRQPDNAEERLAELM